MSRLKQLAAHSRTVLGIAISVISLGGCVWWATKQEAPDFPSSADGILLILAAVAVYGIATVLRGWRWHMILRHAHIEHQLKDAVAITTIGYMGNTVLPARGGEVLRILLLSDRSNAKRREVLGSIVPERILDAAALVLLFLVLSLVLSREAPTGITPGIIVGGLLLAGLIGVYVYHRLRWHGHFDKFAARVRPVARASRLLIHPWGAGLMALTLFVWGLEGVVFDLCAQALKADISYAECLLTVVIASFFSLIPAGARVRWHLRRRGALLAEGVQRNRRHGGRAARHGPVRRVRSDHRRRPDAGHDALRRACASCFAASAKPSTKARNRT